MDVRMAPGAMALTRIRTGATFWARLRIIIMIPPLDAHCPRVPAQGS